MEEFFATDRGHVFDALAARLAGLGGVRARDGAGVKAGDAKVGREQAGNAEDPLAVHTLASQMINCYRGHTPRIHLYPDAARCLEALRARHIPLGLITDGLASVQEKKVRALGLADVFDLIIYTDLLAPNRLHWKPSPRAFELAARHFGVPPSQCCYVGDNPAKDFTGPAQLGMPTVWVERPEGIYTGCALPATTGGDKGGLGSWKTLPVPAADESITVAPAAAAATRDETCGVFGAIISVPAPTYHLADLSRLLETLGL
ncbi:MAG: HAD family hydrolase [Firmicutes bacterium]|nr:HAD family hydrolase [Bacillota bacterium]